MRLISILTAVLVMGVLYLLVFERERIVAFARGGDDGATTATNADAAPQDTAAAETDEPDGSEVPVVVLRSSASVIDSVVLVRGRTEAARQVDVRAETSGLVISPPLRKGAFAEAGQLLCRLDTGTREASLSEAEARLSEARAQVADAEINQRAAARLSEGGFASETRVTAATAASQSALAAVQSAEAGVAAARKELERLEIRAPFSGLLESDAAELGSLLQPGGLCATIIQLDPIKLVGFVPETEVDRIAIGAQAGARLASGREVIGTVTFLSRSADDTTRTFRVEIEVENADLSIRDGQTAEIAIGSEGATAHLIPQSALTLDDDGRLGVRLVRDGKAAFAPVTVLRDTVDGVWVAGLDAEASVIVVGQEFVTDGVAVAATYREARK